MQQGPKEIIQLPSTSKSSIIIIIAMTMWHVMCSLGPVPLVLLVAIRKIRIMVRVSFCVLLSVMFYSFNDSSFCTR